MKTLIIYNSIEEELQYFIVEGDFSRFNGVCINSTIPHNHIKECIDWLYHPETGNFKHELSNNISLIEDKNWDKVAIITWLP